MDYITELIKILVPALLVLYAMYLVVRSFLNKQFDEQMLQLKAKNTEVVLPIRLQAYERIALLLERLSPNNMLIRLSEPTMSAFDFQQLLLKEIQEEKNHNLSQQVYISDDAWNATNKAINAIITVIQTASSQMDDSKNAIDLAEAVFGEMMKLENDPTAVALSVVKNELRLFL